LAEFKIFPYPVLTSQSGNNMTQIFCNTRCCSGRIYTQDPA